ncbi:MAG: HAD-IIIA family hydrolase [Verrucomicrobiota bacterium]|nr:HAD-IIIA family hydrolase [Verrucomicrobiota bacterium]
MKQAVILAGGKGTRLKERLGELPKPLISIGGRPLLGHHLALCERYGFSDVVLLLGHGAEKIQQYVNEQKQPGLQLRCIVEPRLLGTAGAVVAARERLAERFLVVYGDLMIRMDLDRLWHAHEAMRAYATLVVHPNDHPYDSDLIEVDKEGWVCAFHAKPHPPELFYQNLVNAAVYVVERKALEPFAGLPMPLDFGKDLFPLMLRKGCRLLGYRTPEYIKDIGTPDRYDRVCAEFEKGVIARSALDHPQPAVFLDRDGTLNEEVDGVTKPDQLRLLPGAAEAVRMLNHHGIRVVVVTNQPVVAKGFCTEADIEMIHRKLETLLGREHAFIDRIYYCPHHPERGFPGERPDLKIECECRKPRPGLIRRAMKELNIDPNMSWVIGDSTVDIATAKNSGLPSILVRTGHKGLDGRHPVEPDLAFDSLLEAARYVVEKIGRQP